MIVVSYADFFENPAQYREDAEVFGIKILPKKKERKSSRKLQERTKHLDAVVGLIPPEVDADALLAERRMSQ